MDYSNFIGPGMEGTGMPEFKGLWINKNTGATVVVRDTILMDSGFTVMLSDGTMLDMNDFSNNYFQMSEDSYDSRGNKIDKSIPLVKPMPQPTPKPCHCPKPTPKIDPEPKEVPDFVKEKSHMKLIEKLFSVKNPSVTAKAMLEVEDFPKDELQMLLDVYGVHIEDIAVYIYKTYYTPELVVNMIKEYLTDTQGLKEPEDITDDTTNP